jgi:hypothetical protein
MVLIIVVVVVAMLSLAGLSFVATMHTENKAVHIQANQLQLEHVVGSGVEFLKVFFEQSRESQQAAGGAWDNPDRFSGVLVLDDGEGGRRGRFSVVAPRTDGSEAAGVRFGVEDESARLNLGVLLQWESKQPGAAHLALMGLPGMTDAVADAILDWIDPDDAPRPFGAEAEYYQGLAVPYAPRNGVPQCLEELLLVRGVTRDLLFGADANFNHRIDPEERRAVESGGAISLRELPWASLLTVSSAERNQSADGQPRIDLNQQDLVALRRALAAALDGEWADFIVLYRQFGPYEGDEPASTQRTSISIRPLPGKVRIESVLDLVDAAVRVEPEKGKKPLFVASPLAGNPVHMREQLPKLLDRTTVESGPVIYGRVNVNLAPREVLRAVPGMDPGLVEQILGARRTAGRDDAQRRHPTWLLTEGLVDIEGMKALLPYLTGGGDVVRAQVIGFFDEPGPAMRVETVIDATTNPPRQVYWKDLRLLGRGYALESLGATQGKEGSAN